MINTYRWLVCMGAYEIGFDDQEDFIVELKGTSEQGLFRDFCNIEEALPGMCFFMRLHEPA